MFHTVSQYIVTVNKISPYQHILCNMLLIDYNNYTILRLVCKLKWLSLGLYMNKKCLSCFSHESEVYSIKYQVNVVL